MISICKDCLEDEKEKSKRYRVKDFGLVQTNEKQENRLMGNGYLFNYMKIGKEIMSIEV